MLTDVVAAHTWIEFWDSYPARKKAKRIRVCFAQCVCIRCVSQHASAEEGNPKRESEREYERVTPRERERERE